MYSAISTFQFGVSFDASRRFQGGVRLPLLANTLAIKPTKTDKACVGQLPPLLNFVQTSVDVAFCGLSYSSLAQPR